MTEPIEVRVWIAQCVCGPARHAIMANAGEALDEQAAQHIVNVLREKVGDWIKKGVINPWCGLCHAPAEGWRYEVGRTAFRTLAEAMPALRDAERQQAAVRAAFGDIPRSD